MHHLVSFYKTSGLSRILASLSILHGALWSSNLVDFAKIFKFREFSNGHNYKSMGKSLVLVFNKISSRSEVSDLVWWLLGALALLKKIAIQQPAWRNSIFGSYLQLVSIPSAVCSTGQLTYHASMNEFCLTDIVASTPRPANNYQLASTCLLKYASVYTMHVVHTCLHVYTHAHNNYIILLNLSRFYYYNACKMSAEFFRNNIYGYVHFLHLLFITELVWVMIIIMSQKFHFYLQSILRVDLY